jgi:predicted deacylase
MGGRSQFENDWAGRIAAGLRRALAAAGVLDLPDTRAESVRPPVPVKPSTVLRPIQGGIFVPTVRADAVGTIVPGGTVLGHLVDPVTYAEVEVFRAPFAKTALMLLRPMIARVEGGAMTYVVSEPA